MGKTTLVSRQTRFHIAREKMVIRFVVLTYLALAAGLDDPIRTMMNRVSVFHQVGHIHTILHFQIRRGKFKPLCDNHTIWHVQIQTFTNGCLTINGLLSQEIMENIFCDMADIECYLDHIGIFSKWLWHTHMEMICEVLQRLQNNGFTVNPLKCEWAVTKTN
jgi:hypothetical protein